jgi:hypothetical protein
MRSKLAVVAFVSVLAFMAAFSGVANASIVTGSLQTLPMPAVGDVIATDGWNFFGFKIAWTISSVAGGWDGTINSWHYKYELTNAANGGALYQPLKELGISVDGTMTELANIRNLTVTAADAGYPAILPYWSDGGAGWYPSAASAMPAALVVHSTTGSTTYTMEFDTDRVPTLGDFFAADGTSVAGTNCVAYNSGLVSTTGARIQVPGAQTIATPEPSTLIVWSLLGALVITVNRLRRK